MKRPYVAPFLFAALLTACGHPSPEPTSGRQDPLNLSAIDSAIRPQDDFFHYANGGWLQKQTIPADRTSVGTFTMLADTVQVRVRGILDSLASAGKAAPGTVAQQLSDFYGSGMDSADRDKAGYGPVKPELDSIAGIKNPADALRLSARFMSINHGPLFSFSVSPDDRDATTYIAHFDQGGLSLPTRDYYFRKDSSTAAIRDAFLRYVDTLFRLTGEPAPDATRDAAAVLAFETELARVSKSPVQLRDPVANYHKYTRASLTRELPLVATLATELHAPFDSVLVGQPEFYKGLTTLLARTPVPVIKAYLRAQILRDDSKLLSSPFEKAAFEYGSALTGSKVQQPRWERMIALTDNYLGDEIGELYVKKYFPPEAKARVNALIDNLIATYEERIKTIDWMSDSTRQKALVKLHAIVRKIGYPDKWKDYSKVEVAPHNLVANVAHCARFEFDRWLARIGKPVDRSEWFMTPTTVNAYYDPTQNNINFPAAILSPPFFFADGDDAVNYGGIGFVIGHEITHGFDDQGRQYDASGNLSNWWTPEDEKKFKARARNIIDQYNAFVAIDTMHVNGELTEGENLADNGGVAIAYRAFHKTPQGQSKDSIGGLSPDQRFFFSVAQVWRGKYRPELMRLQLLSNPHSPPAQRVNGPLSNTPAFYDAFHVKPGDKMYRPDSVRVNVW